MPKPLSFIFGKDLCHQKYFLSKKSTSTFKKHLRTKDEKYLIKIYPGSLSPKIWVLSTVWESGCNPLLTYLLKKGSMSFDLADTHIFGGLSKEPREEKQDITHSTWSTCRSSDMVSYTQRGNGTLEGPHILQQAAGSCPFLSVPTSSLLAPLSSPSCFYKDGQTLGPQWWCRLPSLPHFQMEATSQTMITLNALSGGQIG
jgi:hypothetical protein